MHTKSSLTVIITPGLLLDTKALAALDSELVDELVETGAADFQFRGGAGEVAFISGEGGFDHLSFDGRAGFAETLALELRILRNSEVLRCNAAVFRHDGGTLNTVFE